MSFLRLLNVQGIAGLVASLCLALLLVLQKAETRHWRKQSGQYEQLLRGEQAAHAGTIANYRAAAEAARAADKAAAERVRAEQAVISQRSNHALDLRLADARARALRLRRQNSGPATDPGGGAAAPVPALSAAPDQPHEAAAQDRLPLDDRLLATEQAIQLDELIKWVEAQSKVDPDASSPH